MIQLLCTLLSLTVRIGGRFSMYCLYSMENSKKIRPETKLRLMDQVRQVLRHHHYAYRTEQTYCDWVMRYIRYHGVETHPRNMGKREIEAFLFHLEVQQKVAASTYGFCS